MKSFEWKRAAVSLAIVLVAYFVYVLAVVPWVEPPLRRKDPAEARNPEYEIRSTDRFQQQLKAWFPADAWEMQEPNVLHSDGMTVLFEDYQPRDDGTVHIHPCTVVYQPEQNLADSPATAPLILQAPDGALLRLSRPLDLRAGQVGQPVEGRLLGRIQIHSPGTEDGRKRLKIITSNVQIKPQRLWTPHEVLVEFDGSSARGQDLMIKMIPGSWDGAQRRTTGLGGIRSLELVRLDHLHLEIDAIQQVASDAAPSTSEDSGATVDVSCRGPFRIDLQRNVATFEDQVALRRRDASGVEDTLRCELLSLFLDPVPAPKQPPPNPDAGQSTPLPRWTIRQVVAEGNPAELHVASKKAWVRGRKLLYDLQQRRFRLWSSDPQSDDQVMLRQDAQQIQARDLDCQLAADQSIDKLRASGPGQYRGTIPGESPEAVQASWQGELRLERDGDDYLLSLERVVQVESVDRSMDAGEVHLWLESAPRVLAGSNSSPVSIRPKRLLALTEAGPAEARGVRIRSPEINGQTGRLEAVFQHQPPPAQSPIRAVSVTTSDSREPRGRLRGFLPADAAQPPPTLGVPNAGRSSELEVEGQTVSVVFQLMGNAMSVQQVALRGQAQLRQQDPQNPSAESFRLLADAVDLRDMTGQGGHYVVASGQPVQVQTNRLVMQTAQLQLDRVQNRLWSEGPGRATIQVDRDLEGRMLETAQSLTVDWQRQMQFDGTTIRFSGNVEVVGQDQRMRAETLALGLTQRIDFAAVNKGRGEPQIGSLLAAGNVLIEYREMQQGQRASSSYLQVPQVQIDQQTGEAQASGPGRLILVRQGFSRGLTLPHSPAASPPVGNLPAGEPDGRLTYIQIDFQRQLQGDLRRHVVQFQDRVQVLYGPVSSWNETLQAHSVLGPDQVLLTCDQLTLSEGSLLPTGKRSVGLSALGNTYIEGQAFTARGERMSYEQAKDLLVLEGTARVDAVLSHQSRVGAPRSEHAARKILYWPRTQRVEVDDARYLDLSNLGTSGGDASNSRGAGSGWSQLPRQ